ncbi:hypothetical protein ONS95_010833 [Cadophora gregata]|uniref:uncharacterized protein n=1 Tax=Cadophora gregata TaxID=51156 RepID=UPI0026DBD6D9|nr:uncharacterized protein ONS95_010833 [Cadophora gregata]KAK0119382.1 hypothetical protein ONS95_010833 [Cadophora gregata]KAK0120414.1 hypothetical protein ONS96_010629 [Cadophora gregata f. sp. sojae]
MEFSTRDTNLSPVMDPRTPFKFPGGDIRLKVTYGGEVIIGSVCSEAMASACKVWKNFVYPPWAEQAPVNAGTATCEAASKTSTKNGCQSAASPASVDCRSRKIHVQELDFREDDGESLLILLNIAHGKFEDVPSELPYSMLVSIAVLCDQYDCVKITKPWIEDWLKGEDVLSLKPGNENWLFITWVFGRVEVFEELAIYLIRTIRIDDDGYCRNTQDTPLAEPLPAGIIEPIASIRKEVLRQLLSPAYKDYELYDRMRYPICRRGKTKESQLACDASIHQSLKTSLERIGLLPMKHHKEIQYNVNELCGRLRSITIERADPTHMCAPPYKYSAHFRQTMINIPSPMKRFHMEHMRMQREALDLDSG